MIRYCGEKLYDQRIGTYMQAVKAVLEQARYNPILKRDQLLEQENASQTNSKATGKPYTKDNNQQKEVFTPLQHFSPVKEQRRKENRRNGRSGYRGNRNGRQNSRKNDNPRRIREEGEEMDVTETAQKSYAQVVSPNHTAQQGDVLQ